MSANQAEVPDPPEQVAGLSADDRVRITTAGSSGPFSDDEELTIDAKVSYNGPTQDDLWEVHLKDVDVDDPEVSIRPATTELFAWFNEFEDVWQPLQVQYKPQVPEDADEEPTRVTNEVADFEVLDEDTANGDVRETVAVSLSMQYQSYVIHWDEKEFTVEFQDSLEVTSGGDIANRTLVATTDDDDRPADLVIPGEGDAMWQEDTDEPAYVITPDGLGDALEAAATDSHPDAERSTEATSDGGTRARQQTLVDEDDVEPEDAIDHDDLDACQMIISGSGKQCGNGTKSNAADAERGLCGMHVDSRGTLIDEIDGEPYAALRDELAEAGMTGSHAYRLATLTPDATELWRTVTSAQEQEIGGKTYSPYGLGTQAKYVARLEDVDAGDHPLAEDNCVAIIDGGAMGDDPYQCKTHGHGDTLLCGMHEGANDLTTIYDDEDGPDAPHFELGESEYLAVEQRGEDLIAIALPTHEVVRLEDVTFDVPVSMLYELVDDAQDVATDEEQDEERQAEADAGDDQEDEDEYVPPWVRNCDGSERLVRFLRTNYATTDRAQELAEHFETLESFDAATFEEKLRATGVNGRAKNAILAEYDNVSDLQYRAGSGHALENLDGVGSTSAHVVGQSFLSWSGLSGAPPQAWNALVDGEPEIAPVATGAEQDAERQAEGGAGDVQELDVDERAEQLAARTLLSEREAEVRARKEAGMTHQEIADEDDVSKGTIDTYSSRITGAVDEAEELLEQATATLEELEDLRES